MDAITLLKKDHQRVTQLFARYTRTRTPTARSSIADAVFAALEAHSTIEREFFYPALQALPGKHAAHLAAAALEEHGWIDELVSELKGSAPGDAQFEARFSVLKHNVQHHVREEEKEIFPYARQRLDFELRDLGTRMEDRKQELAAGNPVAAVFRSLVHKAMHSLSGNGHTAARSRRQPKSGRRNGLDGKKSRPKRISNATVTKKNRPSGARQNHGSQAPGTTTAKPGAHVRTRARHGIGAR